MARAKAPPKEPYYAIECNTVAELARFVETRGRCGALCGHVHTAEVAEVCNLPAGHPRVEHGWDVWNKMDRCCLDSMLDHGAHSPRCPYTYAKLPGP